MEVRSIYKNARLSTLKGRDVARVIQGMNASEALNLLSFTPRKAARILEKTLRSAIANAENNNNLDADSLYIKTAVVTTGPSLKRFKPRARGGAAPIRKPMSHVMIIVSDEEPEQKQRGQRYDLSEQARQQGGKKKAARKQSAAKKSTAAKTSSKANSKANSKAASDQDTQDEPEAQVAASSNE